MRTKFVLFCWGRKTSATEYELQNAPLNTFSPSKTLQVKWNKNTRTDALNPLNLYLTLNLNDSRTEINHCSHKHKQVSDSFIKDQLETKEKPTKKTWILGRKRFLKSGRRLRASNQTMLTLNAARNKTTPAATCRQTTRSIGSTIYRRLQAAAVRLNHSYTRDTKNTLIYKLNHLHRLPKETKHSLLNKQFSFDSQKNTRPEMVALNPNTKMYSSLCCWVLSTLKTPPEKSEGEAAAAAALLFVLIRLHIFC